MKDFKKISINGINKAFGAKKALNNFNLTLAKGEFVTFLGPSGCGKSTALNCIAGLIPITSGEIYIDDECIDNSIKKVPAEKREFGMVFQNYALFPHLTIYNNIAFGLQIKKAPKNLIKEKIDNVLNLVHLTGYEDKYPAQLSGGEQQRVAIARCIVLEPRLLMLDEPLSNLDAKLRIDMRYEIKSIHDRLHITSIYVTHDQQEALALSDRIVVMRSGVVQQIGTPDIIYSKPANLFVADFMGFRNIWEGKIEGVTENKDEVEFKINISGLVLVSKIKKSCTDEDLIAKLINSSKSKENILTAIRPEDINIGKGVINNFNCSIDVVEYLGQINQISGRHENGKRIDLRSQQDVKVTDNVSMWIQPEKILVFPKEGGH